MYNRFWVYYARMAGCFSRIAFVALVECVAIGANAAEMRLSCVVDSVSIDLVTYDEAKDPGKNLLQQMLYPPNSRTYACSEKPNDIDCRSFFIILNDRKKTAAYVDPVLRFRSGYFEVQRWDDAVLGLQIVRQKGTTLEGTTFTDYEGFLLDRYTGEFSTIHTFKSGDGSFMSDVERSRIQPKGFLDVYTGDAYNLKGRCTRAEHKF
jgi:hypothetical protein